jgi:tRNA-dihydrouridine synthase
MKSIIMPPNERVVVKNERHLRETIQKQADKIKELEADWLDEYTKCQLIGKELTKLNKIINFIQRGMEGNEQFEQVINDLKGYE